MRSKGKGSILCGVLAAVFVLGEGAGRAGVAAQERVRPAGEVVVVLTEDFMNAVLDAVLAQPSAVKFPLARGGSRACASEIELRRETDGHRTAVRFAATARNVDHVVAGPRGVFAIETKSLTKRFPLFCAAADQ